MDPQYFTKPGIIAYLASLFVLVFMTVGCFAPQWLRQEYVGNLAKLYEEYILDRYNVQFLGVYRILMTVHIFDSFVAINLAWRKGITDKWTLSKWFLQTLLTGWFSLNLIKAYQPESKPSDKRTMKMNISKKRKYT